MVILSNIKHYCNEDTPDMNFDVKNPFLPIFLIYVPCGNFLQNLLYPCIVSKESWLEIEEPLP